MITDIVNIKPKPEGLDKPYVGTIIKVMSDVNTAIYRWSGGLLGSTWRVGSAFPWGIPLLLLTTMPLATIISACCFSIAPTPLNIASSHNPDKLSRS